MFLLLLLLLQVYADPLSNFYITFITNSLSVQSAPPQSTLLLASIMDSDDSPFTQLALPFPLTFYGVNIHSVFVSPNGGMHKSDLLNCFILS